MLGIINHLRWHPLAMDAKYWISRSWVFICMVCMLLGADICAAGNVNVELIFHESLADMGDWEGLYIPILF